jgi:hypothetical protein
MKKRKDTRRLRHRLDRVYGLPTKRPKSLRCARCKRKILVKPKGPLPLWCSHACRQRAYEQEKWGQPHLARLRQDLNSVAMRSAIRQELWVLLKELGLSAEPAPAPLPGNKRPSLRLVKEKPD